MKSTQLSFAIGTSALMAFSSAANAFSIQDGLALKISFSNLQDCLSKTGRLSANSKTLFKEIKADLASQAGRELYCKNLFSAESEVGSTLASGDVVEKFIVNPQKVKKGEPAVFVWKARGVNHCSIKEEGGGVDFAGLGQSGKITFYPAKSSSFTIECTGASGNATANGAIVVEGAVDYPPSTYTPSCTFTAITAESKGVDLPAGAESYAKCIAACASSNQQGAYAGICLYNGADGSVVQSVQGPVADQGDGSCEIEGRKVHNGQEIHLFMFPNGNPANGPGNHDSCVSSSVGATCVNGKFLGVAMGSYTSQFMHARCFDDELNEETLTYLLTGLYNRILKRQPDAEGMAYWKKQIRARAITMDEIETNFRQVAKDGTDTGLKPSATVETVTAKTARPAVSGTAVNVQQVDVRVMWHSMADTSKRIPYQATVRVEGGKWSYQVPATLPAGEYQVTVYDRNLNLLAGDIALIQIAP